MKKYLFSLLIALVLFSGSVFAINTTSAAGMSIKDFINLLINIGVITPDKIPAVNAWLASLRPVTGGSASSGSSVSSGSNSTSGSGSGVSAPVNVTTVSTLTLDSQTPSWQGIAVSVPNTQSFLDLSFTETGTCSNTSYSAATVYVNNGSVDKEVRYREIQKGEKANFHIDLHNFQGQTIYPKITFNNANAGSCFKLRIDRNEVKSRDTLFPDWVIVDRNTLKAKFLDLNNKGLGLNDNLFQDQNLVSEIMGGEKISITARNLGAKSFRQAFSPPVNFSTCQENDFYSCFDSNDLNAADNFFESIVDRGIAPVLIIAPPSFKPISDSEKSNFLNIFKYKNSHYVDSSSWTCPNTTDQNLKGSGNFIYPYSRFDLSNWYQYSIPEAILGRYKNGIPAIDVGNEFNIGPHLYSCTSSGLNLAEVNDMFSVYSNFTKKFCDIAKNNKQTSIFGGFAYVAANGGGGLATMKIDDTLKKMTPGSFSSCDFISIHNYTGSGMTKDQYFSTLNNALTQVKSVWNKGIIISEFGYGSGTVPPNNSAFTNIISEIGNYIKSSVDVLTAQYYLVLRRDWMQWYPYWADYGQTALISESYAPNQPYYNQFKNSNLAPTPRICTSFTYTTWSPSICPASGQQTRTVSASSPSGCSGGNPVLTQSCTYVSEPQTCTSFNYSDWSSCPVSGTQTRTVNSSSPSGCTGGSPVTSKSCDCVDGKFKAYKYSDNYKKTCPADDWCQMGNENWWSWGNGWIGLNNETWYNYGTGWISRDISCD